MISFLIKHKKSILIITLAFFLGSIVYIGLDAYSRSNNSLVAAMVGSKKIMRRDFEREREKQATALRNQGIDIEEEMQKYLDQQVIENLIREEVLNQAAAKVGLQVADYEVADAIQALFTQQGGTFNRDAYEKTVKYSMGMTPAEFENQLRRQTLTNRFFTALYSVYKLTPAEIKNSYQVQHGNVKNFDENKADFSKQLLETKMTTAQRGFFDQFNNEIKIQKFLED